MDKTEQQIIAEGTWASELLQSDHFNAVFKEYTDTMLAAIVTSEPHETKKREYEYAKLRALIDFNSHLSGLALQAHSLLNPASVSDEME